jgi:alcohol dehydrogenase class IV
MINGILLPREIQIGSGALNTIPEVLGRVGAKRPLIVTDKFLESNGTLARVTELLTNAGLPVTVYSDTVPNPTTDSLKDGLETLRNSDCDAVIALGGGSPIDSAKALALLAVSGGQMPEYKMPRMNDNPALPIIAIVTTAGTGSEATRTTVVTDSSTGEKMLCMGNAFLPTAAIIDYELTLTMPARLTADTGLDALTHAIEAYVSKKANAFTDPLCLAAIKSIGKNLRRAYEDGNDHQARSSMMLAATQAGIAFSNSSVALVHGMSRPLGSRFNISHGLSNAMLLAKVTEYSVTAASQRYADCARAFGGIDESLNDEETVIRFVEIIKLLCQDLEVPTPQAYGIDRNLWDELIPLMTIEAVASGSHLNNPRVPQPEDIATLYREIYS